MTIYCKIQIGQHEIQSRAHPLPAKTRQALILVDGKRDDHLLCDLIADRRHSTLDTLLDLGLIEPSKAMPLDNPGVASLQRTARKPLSVEALRREAARGLLAAAT